MNSIDILYYNYMIDMTSEDRKIMEHCFSERVHGILSENASIMAIHEGKVIDTIKDSIKKIIQKVIDFVHGLIKRLASDEAFVQNENLIKKGKEKLRNMTTEEKGDFLIREALLENLENTDSLIDDMIDKSRRLLSDAMYDCKSYMSVSLYSHQRYVNPESNDQYVDKILEELDKLEDKEEMKKKKLRDVDIKTISSILNSSGYCYGNAKGVISDITDKCKEVENELKKNINEIDKALNNSNDSSLSSNTLNTYKNNMYLSAGCLIRLLKFSIKVKVMMFKNQESILRKFLAY